MSLVIILTAEQAAAVRKQSAAQKARRAALDPVERIDGQFELPAAILTAEEHAAYWPLLHGCQQADDDVTKKRWYAERPAALAAPVARKG